MSVVEQSAVTINRHEYKVTFPAVWADVQEAMAFAARDKKAAGFDTSYDDSIMVTATDDKIVAYWEEVDKQ